MSNYSLKGFLVVVLNNFRSLVLKCEYLLLVLFLVFWPVLLPHAAPVLGLC